MAKKEVFTVKEVEQDILYSIKHPPEMTKRDYKRWAIPGAIAGILLGIVSVIRPKLMLFALLAMVGLLLADCVIRGLLHRRRLRSVRVEDYQMEVALLSHKEEEHYRQSGTRARRGRRIHNYTLHFEGRDAFRVPKDNFCWSREHPMSDLALYQCVHRGGECLLVIEKASGRIVVAYPTEYFAYKEER